MIFALQVAGAIQAARAACINGSTHPFELALLAQLVALRLHSRFLLALKRSAQCAFSVVG